MNATQIAQSGASGFAALGNIYTAFAQAQTQSLLAKAQQQSLKHQAWMNSANTALADMDNDIALQARGIQQYQVKNDIEVANAANNVAVDNVKESADWFYKQDVSNMRRSNRIAANNSNARTQSLLNSASSVNTSKDYTSLFGAISGAANTGSNIYKLARSTANTGGMDGISLYGAPSASFGISS